MSLPDTASERGAETRELTKRERLIAAASSEIHRRGYSATTLANVAESSGVPLGNVYYYFKTKDELVRAVIDRHLDTVNEIIADSETATTPRARVERLLDNLAANCENVSQHGCPLGGLNQELEKLDGRFEGWAEKLFVLQLEWLAAQFRAAGRKKEAHNLAVHFLARTQGASLVSQALADATILRRELDGLRDWLRDVLA